MVQKRKRTNEGGTINNRNASARRERSRRVKVSYNGMGNDWLIKILIIREGGQANRRERSRKDGGEEREAPGPENDRNPKIGKNQLTNVFLS